MQGCEISEFMVGQRSRENGILLDPILDLLGSVVGGSNKISKTDGGIHDKLSEDCMFCNWTPCYSNSSTALLILAHDLGTRNQNHQRIIDKIHMNWK